MRDLAQPPRTAAAIRALLNDAVDYAGLFPPASLSMRDVVRNYAEYANGAHAWALGRVVVPILRLAEFNENAQALLDRTNVSWRVSALAGPGGASEWRHVERHASGNATVDAVELRALTPDDVARAASTLPAHVHTFYEIPIADDPAELIAAIARVGGKAKVRTGGVTPDAFPSADDLARFIVACAHAGVPFKATAGLHHPMRATHRLTYSPDSPRGDMFGFLNLLFAAAFAATGVPVADISELLVERDPASLRLEADGASWRDRRVGSGQIAAARRNLVLSFGSCSFTEPITELQQLGLL